MQKNYAHVSGTLFAVIAVLQATRTLNQWPVQVGTLAVPVWLSWLAAVIAGSLSVWAFRSARNRQ